MFYAVFSRRILLVYRSAIYTLQTRKREREKANILQLNFSNVLRESQIKERQNNEQQIRARIAHISSTSLARINHDKVYKFSKRG